MGYPFLGGVEGFLQVYGPIFDNSVFLEARRRLSLLQLCRSGTKSPGRLTGGSRRILIVSSRVTRSCLSCKYSERNYLCNTSSLIFPP
ncbi:hypothetical protein L204_102568 [Cryptococcus depauperatus]